MGRLVPKLKTSAEVLLLAVIAAFVGATMLEIFVDLFWAGEGTQPTDAFRGGFWGAFLAFIFVRVSQGFDRFYEARKASRRALGRIQFNLNEALNIANDNLFVFEQWERFYQLAMQAPVTHKIPIFANRLDAIPGSRNELIELTSIGLVNELFLLESSTRKLNDSIETWQRAYEVARAAFVAKEINLATYLANVEQANVRAKEIRPFIQSLMDEVVEALAATRLLLQERPFLAKLFGWLNPDQYRPRSGPRRMIEVGKIRGELRDVAAESKARIDAITGGSPTVGTIN